ncbi:hypothetical protein FRC11_010439 [Ceratobasidium sp. 423]|nr:hypothetical protein FRC11_010439 [Ceratobasidium sp. 423]
MCTITTVVSEVEPTVDPVESGCGGIDAALPGANTEREDSEPPTPKKSIPKLPKLIKEEEEEDDPLYDLARLFDLATIDDYEDSDSEDDESAPSSPRPKGFEKFYFYATSSRIHFYDNFRNVYREDGTLVHDGSFDFPLNELFSPSFHIDGVPYCFDLGGLLSSDIHGTPYRVITWQNEPDLFDLGQYVDPTLSQNEPTVCPPNLNSASYYNVAPTAAAVPAANGYCGTPKAKTEVLSPNVNSNSLQQAFQGTGFATKSNMKRHFLTHRVGPLERYRPGVTQPPSETYELGPTKTGKAPRPTSTYNSKAHHTLRFRVAA